MDRDALLIQGPRKVPCYSLDVQSPLKAPMVEAWSPTHGGTCRRWDLVEGSRSLGAHFVEDPTSEARGPPPPHIPPMVCSAATGSEQPGT